MKYGLFVCLAGALAAIETDRWQRAIGYAERLQEQQRPEEARQVLLGALADAEQDERREMRLAYTLNNLGSVAQDQGRYLDAEQRYRESPAHWKRTGEKPHPGMARTLNNLASLLHGAGRTKDAEQLLLRSEEIQSAAVDLSDPESL